MEGDTPTVVATGEVKYPMLLRCAKRRSRIFRLVNGGPTTVEDDEAGCLDGSRSNADVLSVGREVFDPPQTLIYLFALQIKYWPP